MAVQVLKDSAGCELGWWLSELVGDFAIFPHPQYVPGILLGACFCESTSPLLPLSLHTWKHFSSSPSSSVPFCTLTVPSGRCHPHSPLNRYSSVLSLSSQPHRTSRLVPSICCAPNTWYSVQVVVDDEYTDGIQGPRLFHLQHCLWAGSCTCLQGCQVGLPGDAKLVTAPAGPVLPGEGADGLGWVHSQYPRGVLEGG